MKGFEPVETDSRFDETGQMLTPAAKAWRELVKLAPHLAALHKRSWNRSNAYPQALNDGLFVALAACLAHPAKREILRALILDLLADDLQEIIVAFLTEEIDAKSN